MKRWNVGGGARSNTWYLEEEATIIDALAAVRSNLWRGVNYSTSRALSSGCTVKKNMHVTSL
jgi:hypothetical protein